MTTDAEQAALQTGVIQRVRQFTGPRLAQTLVFGWLANPPTTLGDLAATAACCDVTVSPQGLDQRFTPAAAHFLEQLLARALRHVVEADPVALPPLRRFAEVEIRDSTVLTLPERTPQWTKSKVEDAPKFVL
ncbi:MAG: hypothetical protein L0Z62_14935 [Gemmataceae bacterium]|nr:hypothetical protein [Gemmataceae bacterium]